MRTDLKVVLVAALALCALGASRHRAVSPPAAPAGPTFNKEVIRILQAQCQTCHHEGDIAPFPLMTYADAFPKAADMKYMTSTHQMPPWKATSSCGVFNGERLLTQDQIDTIARWADNGAPQGNPADLPPALQFDGGWSLGQPDMVVRNAKPYTPPLDQDMYRCFSLALPADKRPADGSNYYVSAIDVRPGDRTTVHHAIAFIDNSGESAAKDDGSGYPCFGGPGLQNLAGIGALGGWAPGARAAFLPAGVAMQLPASSRIVLQVHYHPHFGRVSPDQTEFAIYLSRTPVDKIMQFVPIINTTFTIPAGASDYQVTATLPLLGSFPVGVHVIGVFPHMHLLGRKMHVEARMPDGSTQCLINIDDWDFNWQGMYLYKDPVALPAGSRPRAVAIYDNSSSNWRNPNSPPQAVSWGEQTTDEMCIAFLAVTIDSEHLQAGQVADRSWMTGLYGVSPRTK